MGKLGKLEVKWARSTIGTNLAKIKIHRFPVVAKEFFTNRFEKTGHLMTVDGSGDEKIHLQGLMDYLFKVEMNQNFFLLVSTKSAS